MWFKKKSVLLAEHHYDTEFSADGTTDLRITYDTYNNTNISITNSGLPSAADAGNYFFLPALGTYYNGSLNHIGIYGYYWSSSADPGFSSWAYGLHLFSDHVVLGHLDRYGGFRVGGFE